MKKIMLLMAFCAAMVFHSSQAQNVNSNVPRASLTYNAQKSEAGSISFNTSFFIFDYNISNETKRAKEREVLKNDPSFKKLELLDVNGTKDMMVIVDVETASLSMLTEKIKNLLESIGVYKVEYNGELVSLDKFNF